ncbi:MAG: hypothetical protein OEW12_09140 [Deltaproteobacteria bacterium]|nr:hypothetical protein [Deltaproteobacteria bacterium]
MNPLNPSFDSADSPQDQTQAQIQAVPDRFAPADTDPFAARPLADYLMEVCRDDGRHAVFLNTVSLLEHLGSRKIMVSQSGPAMGAATLQHLAEETRHAWFFRRAAEKAGGSPMGYLPGQILSAPAAAMYLGRLDAAITRQVGRRPPADAPAGFVPLAYLYVSSIVEVRATWFFHLYQDILLKSGAALNLKGVIAEEIGHLEDLTATLAVQDPLYPQRFEEFKHLEARLFRRFLPQLLDQTERR